MGSNSIRFTEEFQSKTGYKILNHNVPEFLVIKFTDEIEAENKIRKINGVKEINFLCTVHLNQLLQSYNIPTVFVEPNFDQSLVIFKKYFPLPLYVRALNYSEKTLSRIFNFPVYEKLPAPIFEIYHQKDPKFPLNEYHLLSFRLLSLDDSRQIFKLSSKINAILKSYFERRGYDLVELYLEFGKYNNKITLATVFQFNSFVLKPISNSPELIFDNQPPSKLKQVFLNFQKLIY